MTTKLTICYLLESSELSGGVRVVFDQVRALTMRGHNVTVRASRGDHSWYPYPIEIQYCSNLSQPLEGITPHVVIGTFWTTIKNAVEMDAPLTVHLCQGCEWTMPEYEQLRTDIEAAYAVNIPKITIGEWLSAQIQNHLTKIEFPIESVGQIVDVDLYKKQTPYDNFSQSATESLPPATSQSPDRTSHWKVLIVGIYEAWVKGIDVALAAVEQVRKEGFNIHLLRASTFPLSKEEKNKFQIGDTYYHLPTPVQMAELYQNADIFLAPSRSKEGFGLPFTEALCSGLPAVASAIPSHLSIDNSHDYALFTPEGNPQAMAEGIKKLINNKQLRIELVKRAMAVTDGSFKGDMVARRLEACFTKWLMHE